MKKLQNNFTTQEQSERLLELGVPADSADQVYYSEIMWDAHYFLPYDTTYSEYVKGCENLSTPCWSVGRLIEIYVIANGVDTTYLPIEKDEDLIKYLIRLYEEKSKNLDFSKLD